MLQYQEQEKYSRYLAIFWQFRVHASTSDYAMSELLPIRVCCVHDSRYTPVPQRQHAMPNVHSCTGTAVLAVP